MTDALRDSPARRSAETTFDRNVVVIAGAGTGKTTLLANRLVHALMREPDPLRLHQIVALTFTNKSATEMKQRLRARLTALAAGADSDAHDGGAVSLAALRERYRLGAEEIADRARTALADIEKAQIGTLHSFAAHILRLHPLESGVDPEFREDDGLRFEELFVDEWDAWLQGELAFDGRDHARWRRVLGRYTLETLRDGAHALCSELVPLDDLLAQLQRDDLTPALRHWFIATRARASRLLERYDRVKRRNAERALDAVIAVCTVLLEGGLPAVATLAPAAREPLEKSLGSPVGWTEEDLVECAALIRTARGTLAVEHERLRDVAALLVPFARHVRQRFVEQGWLSFDGLLARARTLLREHPSVRERLKREYRAILVDEFQDTDPAQYEIILYLAERPGRSAAEWRDVEPEPGKLFIVGDPKQSIYAFRRADIEAFDRVVEKLRAAGADVHALSTNFRSHAAVLDVVNACFDRLLTAQPTIQPANVPLDVRPGRQAGIGSPGAVIRVVRSESEDAEFDARAATRVEADRLATWLKDEVLGKETIIDAQGRRTPLQPGHIALLFRTLTQSQEYLDALRRHDIDYLTDGEKHFYRRQEVVDAMNLLRVIENPGDEIAMAGVLRSPIGGLTDADLYAIRTLDAFDCRRTARLDGWNHPRGPVIRRLYGTLAELHGVVGGVPLPDAIDAMFARLPVLELAAASLHGEQAVANLLKLRDLAVELSDRPHLSLNGFVELMIARLDEQPDEAESALAEESLDAVRVLTIHKAKGLEFPVVVLPGLHHGTAGGRREPIVLHDWSSGAVGFSIGETGSLGAVMVREKHRVREDAERRRLFYVGMTRARERLVLSAGIVGRAGRGTLWSLLKDAVGTDPLDGSADALAVGEVSIPLSVLPAPDRAPKRSRGAAVALRTGPGAAAVLKHWEPRREVWNRALALAPSSSVSSLMARDEPVAEPPGKRGDSRHGRLIGTLAHAALQHWDFEADPAEVVDRLWPSYSMSAGFHNNDIADEVKGMLKAFLGTAAHVELRRAAIIGREVPFAIPRPIEPDMTAAGLPHQTVLEGVLDVLYRHDGRLWIADYKTDRLDPDEAGDRAASYGLQARLYRDAAHQCLNVDVAFKFIFVRTGQVVVAS